MSDTGQTGELKFALAEVRQVQIPYAELNRVVGYDLANIVQGFTVLDEARSAALFDYAGLDTTCIRPRYRPRSTTIC